LAAIEPPSPSQTAILDAAETIERVDRERSGRVERLRRRDELVDQRDGVLRELAVARDSLGVDEAYTFDLSSIPSSSVATQISDAAGEIVVRRRALDEQRGRAEAECARAEEG